MEKITKAIEDLKMGGFVLVHDFEDREDETDMVAAAQFFTREHVARMRMDAGGLICVAVGKDAAEEIGLPFMVDVYSAAKEIPLLEKITVKDIKYDYKSAFSLSVNHKDTFTGIPDNDRALTIRRLGEVCREPSLGAFKEEFRSPGHVHLLISSGLKCRQGHTELSTALIEMANLSPVTCVCEMLDSESGEALTKSDAIKYAEKHNLTFLEGEEVKRAYEDWSR